MQLSLCVCFFPNPHPYSTHILAEVQSYATAATTTALLQIREYESTMYCVICIKMASFVLNCVSFFSLLKNFFSLNFGGNQLNLNPHTHTH